MSPSAESPLLTTLNEAQRQGVLHTEGPCLIIAGAGSGKTRTLVHRIAYLLKEKDTHPLSIMALTFTNKAAREMTSRIEALIGGQALSLWMGTFHSIFARILRIEAHKIGYTSNYSILDTEDAQSVLRTLIQELQLDDKTYRPNRVLNCLSYAKNSLISWRNFEQQGEWDMRMPHLPVLYKHYVSHCKKANAMDFDDLLYNTHLLFQECPEVLLRYQNQIKYLLIDEFQDTNYAQYQIVKELTAAHQNICAVGDDAQSIYSFRGARIENLLSYQKDYPELRLIRLEQNYRSTKCIVSASNSLILHNKVQIPKKLWTNNSDGDKIQVCASPTDQLEAQAVASGVFEQIHNFQCSPNEIALLYRSNRQSRLLEESLRKINIHYRIYGGFSFYQRREIKDLLSYLRLIVNPHDEASFLRIVNVPQRGIGRTTVQKVFHHLQNKGVSLGEALGVIESFLPARSASILQRFVEMMDFFRLQAKHENAFSLAKRVLKESGMEKALKEKEEEQDRLDNLDELLNAIHAFSSEPTREDRSLAAFLQEVSLLTSADEGDPEQEMVNLMTIHMAKGLEFKVIFLVGLEEGTFPSPMSSYTQKDLEEERRLCYVALTRAKARIFIHYAAARYHFGSNTPAGPSRFLAEIDPNQLHYGHTKAPFSPVAQSKLRPFQTLPDDNPKTAHLNQLRPGQRVRHDLFGTGTVIRVETFAGKRKADIRFDNAGYKTILLAFGKINIIK